jgi:hypothetical protein
VKSAEVQYFAAVGVPERSACPPMSIIKVTNAGGKVTNSLP